MTKKRKIADFDANGGTFRFDGVLYERDKLPQHIVNYLGTVGLQTLVARSKDAAKLYTQLQAGSIKERAGKTLVYSTWHQAAAAAHAIDVVKAAGVRPKPAKKLYDTDEFTVAYNEALVTFSPWSREKTKAAQERSAVVQEHERIIGLSEKSFAEIFGAKPAAETGPDLPGATMDDAA